MLNSIGFPENASQNCSEMSCILTTINVIKNIGNDVDRMWRSWNPHILLLKYKIVQLFKKSLLVSQKTKYTYQMAQKYHSGLYSREIKTY